MLAEAPCNCWIFFYTSPTSNKTERLEDIIIRALASYHQLVFHLAFSYVLSHSIHSREVKQLSPWPLSSRVMHWFGLPGSQHLDIERIIQNKYK